VFYSLHLKTFIFSLRWIY